MTRGDIPNRREARKWVEDPLLSHTFQHMSATLSHAGPSPSAHMTQDGSSSGGIVHALISRKHRPLRQPSSNSCFLFDAQPQQLHYCAIWNRFTFLCQISRQA